MIIVALIMAASLASSIPTSQDPGSAAPLAATFEPTKDGAAILTWQEGRRTKDRPVRTVTNALALLADQHANALWPTVENWAGARLEPLRNRNVLEAQAVFATGRTKRVDTGLASIVRPPLRARFVLVDALWEAGRRDDARRLLQEARSVLPAEGLLSRMEWEAVIIRLAQMRAESSDLDGAITGLSEAVTALTNKHEGINSAVNRALLLAVAGRSSEALNALDEAQVRSDVPSGLLSGVTHVRGSDRNFASIRACALYRMGRTGEAAEAAGPMNAALEGSDRRFVVPVSVKVRVQYALCARDADAAAHAYADWLRAEPIGSEALLQLQPALRAPNLDPAFAARIRAHPALAPLLAERMRTLPETYGPALNGWAEQ